MTILTGHRALRLVINEQTLVCEGVEIEEEGFLLEQEEKRRNGGRRGGDDFLKGRKRRLIRVEKEVVVSCGSISSPQLLMLSGVGPKGELEKVGVKCLVNSPDVGNHMEDHLSLFVRALVKEGSQTVTGKAVEDAEKEWKEKGEGALASSAADCSYFFVSDAGKEVGEPYPDLQLRLLFFFPFFLFSFFFLFFLSLSSFPFFPLFLFFFFPLSFPFIFSFPFFPHYHHPSMIVSPCDEAFYHGNLRYTAAFNDFTNPTHKIDVHTDGVCFVITHLHPRSRGKVSLTSSHPLDPPSIQTNFLDNQHDLDVLKNGAHKMVEVCTKSPLSNLEIEIIVPPHVTSSSSSSENPIDWESYARHYAKSLYHPTSTLQMGKVLTPDLRVKGVKGLRVADGSVMPGITSGNTNAPIIMIGEKVVDFMAREHGLVLSSTSSGSRL